MFLLLRSLLTEQPGARFLETFAFWQNNSLFQDESCDDPESGNTHIYVSESCHLLHDLRYVSMRLFDMLYKTRVFTVGLGFEPNFAYLLWCDAEHELCEFYLCETY